MNKHEAIVAGYRHAADLIEEHDLPAPIITSRGDLFWALYSWECPDGVPAMVAKIRRTIGGKWDKHEEAGYDSPKMVFSREGYTIETNREAVCVRRVVGTETVIKPAVNLPERAESVEIVEWDCEPVLEASAR